MKKEEFNNSLIFSHEDILEGELPCNQEYEKAENEQIINIFEYENILQEYDLETGDSSLYLKQPDGDYELLFSSQKNRNEIQYVLCANDDVYISSYEITNQIPSSLLYLKKEDFIFYFNKLFEENKNSISKKIKDFGLQKFLFTNSTELFFNGKNFIEDSYSHYLYEQYNKFFAQYTSATNLLPTYVIIDDILTDIHTYIVTKELDTNKLSQHIVELQSFKDFCPNSIELCKNFIKDPKGTDLRFLCSSLEKNQKNIENILSIHLEDKLKDDTKGER